MKKNKTIMLESKTYGQGFMFSYRYLTPESLVEYDEILRKTFKEYCIKHKLFPVRDIKIHHDPYYFYTHCVKVGCKNDDIDTCYYHKGGPANDLDLCFNLLVNKKGRNCDGWRRRDNRRTRDTR